MALNIVKLVGRTEKLKKQGGPMWPWVYVEALLTVTLLGCSIWGAVLTFDNFDLKGNGPEECAPAAFIAVFVSVIITFVIFVAIAIIIVYVIIQEMKKEATKEQSEEDEHDTDEEAQ